MTYKIEIFHKQHIKDIKAEETERDILDLGLKGINEVKFVLLYELDGDFTAKEITGICKNLLIDEITQDFNIFLLEENTKQKNICQTKKKKSDEWVVEVWFKKGVTDTVGETVKKGIRDLGLKNEVNRVKTG
ncbi:phosphoribosylformylglycinamidine synthase subunit PurS, partial [bacterium]|nr:phosphoribosylformylglycinamidine synthase subunit PurS [bacterium]